MRSVGPPLRIVVITLDRGQNDVRSDAPATILRNLGHQVLVAGYDFAELDRKAPPADIAVVEAGSHLEIGRDAIKRLRARPELLAARVLVCVEVGRVSGLNAEELTARLAQLHARDKRPGSPLQIRYGEMTLDCEVRQASIGGQPLGLTPYEFQLLRFLVDRVGRVFTRQELLSRVWDYRHVGRARTVDTHVLNLRTKMGRLGDRLQSVRGLGYKLLRSDQSPGMALSAG